MGRRGCCSRDELKKLAAYLTRKGWRIDGGHKNLTRTKYEFLIEHVVHEYCHAEHLGIYPFKCSPASLSNQIADEFVTMSDLEGDIVELKDTAAALRVYRSLGVRVSLGGAVAQLEHSLNWSLLASEIRERLSEYDRDRHVRTRAEKVKRWFRELRWRAAHE